MKRLAFVLLVLVMILLTGASEQPTEQEINRMPAKKLRELAKQQAKRIAELEKRPQSTPIKVEHPPQTTTHCITANVIAMTKATPMFEREPYWEVVVRLENTGKFPVSALEFTAMVDGKSSNDDQLWSWLYTHRISDLNPGTGRFVILNVGGEESPDGRLSLDIQSITTTSH